MEVSERTIKEPILREFASAKAIEGACVSGRAGGYIITIRYGTCVGTLVSSRGAFRLFTLDNAAKYLRAIGVARFEVDVSGFSPGRIRGPRPDRATALKATKTPS